MRKVLPIKKKPSIFDEIEKMNERISKRAHEIFEGRGCEPGRDLQNWLEAERELVWAPPIEVEEGDREVKVTLSAPGVEVEDLKVEVEPKGILVEAETENEEKDGESGRRALKTAKLFRSVQFGKSIDPGSAKAELKDGVLTLTAKVAEAKKAAGAKTVKVAAR